jgi:hypothetical protein
MENFTKFGGFVVIAGVFLAIFITMMFTSSTLETAAGIIFNRFFANGDGLFYYIEYDGYENLESGLIPYFLSFLGIYFKQLLAFDYINIGQQLTELVRGPVSFAQGANYNLPLQIMILGIPSAIFYLPLASWIVANMRNMVPSRNTFLSHISSFLIVMLSFSLVTDLEFGILRILSVFLTLIFLILPFMMVLKRFRVV